tara:strand:- start:904 stop:1599 length:696 start_codon:yes stop_codon:yes gene_type:complete
MGDNSQKVSILLSVCNAERSIELSIKSILSQTYKNFELLIMDDHSTDKTFKICEEMRSIDSRITLFKNSINLGLTKSLNILALNSNGAYIARQDADDISLDERIEKQLSFLKKNKFDAVYSRTFLKDTKKISPKITHYLPKKIVIKYKNPYIHGTLLIKRKALKAVNFYDEDFYYAQDLKLVLDLQKTNYKIGIMNEPLYILNTENNISSNNKNQQEYYANCARKNINPNG